VDKKKQLTVKLNSIKKNVFLKESNSSTKQAVAATIENGPSSNDDEKNTIYSFEDPPKIKVLQRNYSDDKSIFTKLPKIKHFIISGVAAILVGVILGFIMIKLLSDVDVKNAEDAGTIIRNPSDTEETPIESTTDSKSEAEDKVTYTFDEITQHMVQIGYFSSRETAEEWNKAYQQQNIEPFIWEKDNEYFIFVALAPSKEKADKLEADIKEIVPEAKDAFDKPWQVLAGTKEISSEEGDWITQGMTLWNEAVTVVNDQSSLSSDLQEKLKNWIDSAPDSLSDEGKVFHKTFQNWIENILDKNQFWQQQSLLISIFKAYEEYING
jgi:stage II sporulation protein B